MSCRWTVLKTLVLAASILVRYDTMEILVSGMLTPKVCART
jgi:hypothetical protein